LTAARCAALVLSLVSAAACGRTEAAGALKVNGSTTVAPIVVRAAAELRAEAGIHVRVDVQGGSSGGISQLAEGLVEVGLSSRPILDRDRMRFPECDFRSYRLGVDAVALAVSSAVRDGGVHSVTCDQARSLFEGRIERWSELGGPDLPVFVYDKEPGRGTREVFERWAYGDAISPPASFDRYAQVGGNEEGANKTAAHGSAITLLSAAWVERTPGLAALGIRVEDDVVIEPCAETIATGEYPLARPLFAVTDGDPSLAAAELLDFLLGPRGQELVRAEGFLANGELVASE